MLLHTYPDDVWSHLSISLTTIQQSLFEGIMRSLWGSEVVHGRDGNIVMCCLCAGLEEKVKQEATFCGLGGRDRIDVWSGLQE